MRCFVIAEIGVNHNGDRDMALRLVEEAARAGADAAKFQTFRADAITVRSAGTVAYQKAAGGDSQYAMLKKLELSDEDHAIVAAHCAELGIEFMSTAFDTQSLDLLCRLGVRRVKIPSGEVTNDPYIRDSASRGLPIVLSTGMATLEEVRGACAIVQEEQARRPVTSADGSPPLVVLHCTSAYPTAFDDVNLSAMLTMERTLGLPVGYSDHTEGIFVAPVAVAMGARVIEKHITLDRSLPGPDHAASIEPGELAAMMQAIREAEKLRGDGIKAPRPAELEARALVRRGLKATRDLPAGTVLSAADIAILRPATGLAPARYDMVLGSKLTRSLIAGDPIQEADIS